MVHRYTKHQTQNAYRWHSINKSNWRVRTSTKPCQKSKREHPRLFFYPESDPMIQNPLKIEPRTIF